MAFDKELHVLFTDYSRHLMSSSEKLSDIRWELMRLAGFLKYVQAKQVDWKPLLADSAARSEALSTYAHDMKVTGASDRTIQGMITVTEEFFRHLHLGLDKNNDAEKTKNRQTESQLAVVLENEQWSKLMQVCGTAQERALVAMLLFVGLKSSELMKLNIEDVSSAQIKLRRRNNRVETIDIPAMAVPAVEEWLLTRKAVAKSQSEPLFITLAGNRFAQSAVHYHLKTIGYRAGLNITPELLCKTYATVFKQPQDKSSEHAA
jgi:site-specific recombinase XerD